MSRDFSAVTEKPGLGVTPEALAMVATRYRLAAKLAAGGDVLEVASGAGMGLGLVAEGARRLVGVDLTPGLVAAARRTHGARVGLGIADAQALPFADGSFDAVLLFEALYYLPRADAFVEEASRVLRPGGLLLVCTANAARPGFVRSPHAVAYHGPAELQSLLQRHGFTGVEVLGGFPARPLGARSRLLLRAFSAADRLRLVPRSLEGRARVKRLLGGPLVALPDALDEAAPPMADLVPVHRGDPAEWKVLYAMGRKRRGA